jgi:hypothetical protein
MAAWIAPNHWRTRPASYDKGGKTMRALRLSLLATVTVSLLGGPSIVVLAQDDEDQVITATYVTGETIDKLEVSPGVYSESNGVEQLRDSTYEDTFEWSDPRLPSVMQISENLDIRYREDGDAWAWVGNIRLEDEDGAWAGPEYGMGEWSGDRLLLHPRMMLLTGEGAYEGLTAMLQRRWETDDPGYPASVEGYIFVGDLPPMPDEPSAE